jgi:hypothetical protein
LWSVIALILAFLILAFFADRDHNSLALYDFELHGEECVGLSTYLIIVTIVVERVFEVFNAIWGRPGREKIEWALEDETSRAKQQKLELGLQMYRARTLRTKTKAV